jgi:hypothetical protein
MTYGIGRAGKQTGCTTFHWAGTVTHSRHSQRSLLWSWAWSLNLVDGEPAVGGIVWAGWHKIAGCLLLTLISAGLLATLCCRCGAGGVAATPVHPACARQTARMHIRDGQAAPRCGDQPVRNACCAWLAWGIA